MNNEMPFSPSAGKTPGAPLPDIKPRERETKPLTGTLGWRTIPKPDEDKTNEYRN